MAVQSPRDQEIFIDPKTGKLTGTALRFFNDIVSALDYIPTGKGTPEGNYKAGVGTLYLRTDGGASTTLYVKESGTGNTGWIAK